MERREFSSKKLKIFGYICFCVVMAAAGFLVPERDGAAMLLQRVCGVFFGLMGIPLLLEILRSSPRMVLSEEGLYDRALGTPVIPWASILSIETNHVKKSGYITLHLADEPQWIAKLSIGGRAQASWAKMTKSDVFNDSLSWLDGRPEDITAAILAFKARYTPGR